MGIHRYILFMILVSGAISCQNRKAAEAVKEEIIYTCPMHPEIKQGEPGKCPICGMTLIKKETGSRPVTDIQLEDLLRPTNEFVVSQVNTTVMQKREEEIEIDALGNVGYDNREVGNISARVSGRIEKLYVRYRYQHVEKGQKIMDIYSPEIQTAQENLVFLLRNDPSNAAFIQAAKEKLLLLGLGQDQLQKIVNTMTIQPSISVYSNYNGHIHEAGGASMLPPPGTMKDISAITEELPLKEGMYVQKGQTIFSVYNPDRAWVLLNIYAEDQQLVKVGNPVRVVPETAPDNNFRAMIDYIEPFFRKGSKTLATRIYFNNTTLKIPIGSQVRATIFGNSRDSYWLPKEAVVSLGLDKVVFIKTNGGFRAHRIETGIIHKNHIQVLNGLLPADSVAVNAQFLMDSESFVKTTN